LNRSAFLTQTLLNAASRQEARAYAANHWPNRRKPAKNPTTSSFLDFPSSRQVVFGNQATIVVSAVHRIALAIALDVKQSQEDKDWAG
jgi:hypothetical protein